MTVAEIVRLIGYVASIGLGVFMTVRGVIDQDAALITSGLALVGVGGVAGVNVPGVRRGKYAADE